MSRIVTLAKVGYRVRQTTQNPVGKVPCPHSAEGWLREPRLKLPFQKVRSGRSPVSPVRNDADTFFHFGRLPAHLEKNW